ncbi:hypothetical protein K788_0005894 [Paraburkholderia caribensis MBA4]|uniref:Uncharacterized protein n=1 Tax=Paraburkholderia caribensis MBA4 TaxID=1323664 RepID=A0A0P0R507_9BURK|nr:hypothetical protein K788_0005894 [Paraburkholderia caribensis MBA4]
MRLRRRIEHVTEAGVTDSVTHRFLVRHLNERRHETVTRWVAARAVRA